MVVAYDVGFDGVTTSIPKNRLHIDLADFDDRYSGRTGPKLPKV